MTIIETCTNCGVGDVLPVTLDAVYTHEDKTVSFQDEFMRCDHCGEEFWTTPQSLARQVAITNALRKLEGFLLPDEIKLARTQYGLSLPAFEQALGVGKNTVGRWERGTVPPTGAANLGLWVALNEPEVFARWARRRGVAVPKLPSRGVVSVFKTVTTQSATKPQLTLHAPNSCRASTRTEGGQGKSGALAAAFELETVPRIAVS